MSKSLDDILNDVDEREESPDHPETEVEALPDETPETEAKSKKPPDVETDEKASTEDSQSDEEKTGLPAWMHARLKAEQEKAGKYKTELEKIQSEYQQTQTQLQQFQDWYQQQTGQQVSQEEQMANYLQQLQWQQQDQLRQQRIAISKRFAVQEYGQEEVNRALDWAKAKADADPAFNETALNHPEPVYLAVEAYRKEIAAAELDKYGGDIDKLIEARMAAKQSAQTEPQTSQPEQSARGAMPSNFATAPNQNKGGRSASGWSGPTPLSQLLE